MINDELETEGGIVREAEWVGLWMMFRSGFRRMGRGVRGFHRHHSLVWSIFAAILWGAFGTICIYGMIVLIQIQLHESTCQLTACINGH